MTRNKEVAGLVMMCAGGVALTAAVITTLMLSGLAAQHGEENSPVRNCTENNFTGNGSMMNQTKFHQNCTTTYDNRPLSEFKAFKVPVDIIKIPAAVCLLVGLAIAVLTGDGAGLACGAICAAIPLVLSALVLGPFIGGVALEHNNQGQYDQNLKLLGEIAGGSAATSVMSFVGGGLALCGKKKEPGLGEQGDGFDYSAAPTAIVN